MYIVQETKSRKKTHHHITHIRNHSLCFVCGDDMCTHTHITPDLQQNNNTGFLTFRIPYAIYYLYSACVFTLFFLLFFVSSNVIFSGLKLLVVSSSAYHSQSHQESCCCPQSIVYISNFWNFSDRCYLNTWIFKWKGDHLLLCFKGGPMFVLFKSREGFQDAQLAIPSKQRKSKFWNVNLLVNFRKVRIPKKS